MSKFTLQDHGPECFGLYRDGKRIAVIADCDDNVAGWLVAALNQREELPALRAALKRLTDAERASKWKFDAPEIDEIEAAIKQAEAALGVQPGETPSCNVIVTVHNDAAVLRELPCQSVNVALGLIGNAVKHPNNNGMVFIIWCEGFPVESAIAEGGQG